QVDASLDLTVMTHPGELLGGYRHRTETTELGDLFLTDHRPTAACRAELLFLAVGLGVLDSLGQQHLGLVEGEHPSTPQSRGGDDDQLPKTTDSDRLLTALTTDGS